MQPEPGYYRLFQTQYDDWKKYVNRVYYLTKIEGTKAHLIFVGKTDAFETTYPLEAFLKDFEEEPDGDQIRQKQVVNLMSEITKIGTEQDRFAQTLRALPSPDSIDTSRQSGLVLQNGLTPVEAGVKLKKIKSSIAVTKALVIKKQQALQKFLKEQQLILASKTKALTERIERANDALYMINAYLGTEEEVIKIRDGEPAPADTMIVVRQSILFMDEEIAAAENWMGRSDFDFANVEAFDKWVSKPKNLKQVLPELKGIVALKIRRSEKDYGDNPWVNAELNRKNKCLYLLIRNGERLYRIFTTLWLDESLLPRKNEYEDLFYDNDFDSDRMKSIKKPLEPGSTKYMEAMKKAQKRQQRFYTVMLLIQGLIDRTKVLKPFPVERVNMCDFNESSKYFEFVHDMENLLSDGQLSFNDWQDQLNEKLTVGHRIIGNFEYDYGYNKYTMTNAGERIRPKRAKRPTTGVIYTLEKEEGSDRWLVFYYDRNGDTVYHGWGDYQGKDPTRRAACKISRNDNFILNFDAATVKDIKYYMNSRMHRHNYQTMLPILFQALKAKEKEAATEKPFHKLLVGEIMKVHGVSVHLAESMIEELVSWWKFKNKTHRALTSDDSKAIRMIVKEFGSRYELLQKKEAEAAVHKQVVDTILSQRKDVVAIFLRTDDCYSVYRSCNNDNVFVHHELWGNLSACQMLESDEWQTVSKRHERWLLLWKDARWMEWNIGVYETTVLTDTEIQQGVEHLLEELKCWEIPGGGRFNNEFGAEWRAPLAITQEDDRLSLYYLGRHGKLPRVRILTEPLYGPSIHILSAKWNKTKIEGGYEVKFELDSLFHSGSIYLDEETPWGKVGETNANGKTLRVFSENIKKGLEEQNKMEELKERRIELGKPGWNATKLAQGELFRIWLEVKHQKFLEEYEDDEECTLWKEKKKEYKIPSEMHPSWLDNACDHLTERQIDFDRMTVAEIVTKAKEVGFSTDLKAYDIQFEQLKDFVIDLSQNWKEEDDDDDDEMEVFYGNEE